MSHDTHQTPTGAYLAGLSLAALGVVYGDIGTSPLYALKEVFSRHYGLAVTPEHVLGILSLIVWSLIVLVISVKYLTFVMRADLRGEGGIMVLTALVTPSRTHALGQPREPSPGDAQAEPGETRDAGEGARRAAGGPSSSSLGLFGAALLYGDGMITPAISVLSAIEGLEVATDFFTTPERAPLIPLITIAILIGLFAVQSRGTAGLGKVFGPITLTWFALLAGMGIYHIALEPGRARGR